MTTYRLFDGVAGRPGVGSSGTQPPSSPTSYGGPFGAGTVFQVQQWGMYLDGFWWWVPPGGDTGAQKFTLWQLWNTASSEAGGTIGVIPAATVTTPASGTGQLVAGQMNYVPLATPCPLSAYIPYIAATGWTAVHGFPVSNNQFGSGNPYASGITNGPLVAYSDIGASNPTPSNWANQGLFTTAGADPTLHMPATGSNSGCFWIDVQVDTTAPAGATSRFWPSMPVPPGTVNDTPFDFTLGLEALLAQAVAVQKMWFYSPPGASTLPTEVAFYSVPSQAIIPGTHLTGVTWSGAAGSGFVSCNYGGAVVPAGKVKAVVFNANGTVGSTWNDATANYWSTGGGSAGITAGPMTAPDNASADSPGQSSYNQGTSIAWPGTNAGPFNYWLDPEVLPTVITGSGLLMASGII